MAENNKDTAALFLNMAARGEVREAYSKFVSRTFKHHNPFYEGSAKSLMEGMEENARQNPNKILEVKRAIAEGKFVAVHSHVRQNPDDRGGAVVHIFRFEDGLITELWDIGQPITEESSNQHGMF